MIINNLIRDNIKDEYGIKKLQNIILNIMSDIDQFCKENNIEYYIIGGTALGAVRHGGFIPWDDDLDIAMTRDNYEKFCALCKNKLPDYFYFQEGGVDWPIYISKVRLKNTYIEEDTKIDKTNKGIYIDIFPLDNVPNNKIKQYWWYFWGKALVANSLLVRGYKNASFIKKIIMFTSSFLCIESVKRFALHQITKYNTEKTPYMGGFSFESRFKNTISPSEIWGKPKYIDFEKVKLLAPQKIEKFLEFYFGNYMQMPPVEKRQCKHFTKVDYGIYDTADNN